jgi:hypothetical protein
MASLKLAKGNLDALKAEINTAKSDYRDVLAYAEYPGYMSNTFASKLDEAERQRIVDEDWKQYQDWFKK